MVLVSVTPSYLEGLAQHQDQAAATFGTVADAVSGMAHRVSESHGVACSNSKQALQNAEHAHNKLAYAMQDYAKALAGWLRTAAYAYENAEEGITQSMRRQMT